jgi:exopolysaccharide biosynthesis polyprenyl glycosylphosphotransferase
VLKRSRFQFTATIFVLDLLLTMGSLWLANWLRHEFPAVPFGNPGFAPSQVFLAPGVFVGTLLIWAFFLWYFGVYDERRAHSFYLEVQSLLIAVTISTVVFSAFLFFYVEFFSRLIAVYFYVINLALLINLRWIVRLILRTVLADWEAQRPVLVIGTGDIAREIIRLLRERHWMFLDPLGVVGLNAEDKPADDSIELLGDLGDLPQLVAKHRVDEVIIALSVEDHEQMVSAVEELAALPVRVRIVPDLLELVTARAQVEDLNGIPLIGIRDPAITGFARAVKRAFDLVLSTLAVILLSPLMAAIAIATKLDSPGPIVFKQRRVGENGRHFMMYKFRTMVADAERQIEEKIAQGARLEEVYKPRQDSRVTRIGRILRRTSLDELPNLINVLKGEMSLVGPRPELPWMVERYEPWQRKRLAVAPGMTGWWQINGRSDLPLHHNVQYDLYYIQNYSPLLDLIILWRTIWIVLRGKGAY